MRIDFRQTYLLVNAPVLFAQIWGPADPFVFRRGGA